MANQKIRIPTKKELLAVYPEKNLVEAGKHFGVGQTLFHKWLKHHNIERVRKSRKSRSQVHKENLSKSQKGRTHPNRRRGKTLNCPECKKEFYLRPALINRGGKNYCSIDCRSRAHRNPITEKPCLHCGGFFERGKKQTSGQWNLRKYCSEKCRVKAAPPQLSSERTTLASKARLQDEDTARALIESGGSQSSLETMRSVRGAEKLRAFWSLITYSHGQTIQNSGSTSITD